VLKNGKEVEGRLVEKTDDYIKIDLNGIELTYWIDEIKSIDNETISASEENLQNDSDAAIFVTGTIIFPDWKQGSISLAAFDSPDFSTRKTLSTTRITKPGLYRLIFAPGTKKVFIRGFNDSDDDGGPPAPEDPAFWYGDDLKKPLVLDKKLIRNIDLNVHLPGGDKPKIDEGITTILDKSYYQIKSENPELNNNF